MEQIQKALITREHYEHIIDKLIRVRGMLKEDAIEWADRKFIIGLKNPTVSQTCSGCREIYRLIDAGNDGVWECPVCKKEIEWGT